MMAADETNEDYIVRLERINAELLAAAKGIIAWLDMVHEESGLGINLTKLKTAIANAEAMP